MATYLDLYRVTGAAGNVTTPGAPILSFDLLVNSSTGHVSGHAQITQVVAPPMIDIQVNNVSGRVRTLVFGGQVTLSVVLQGTYLHAAPPPMNYIVLEQFAAQFSLTEQWDGRGSFEYGSTVIDDVPVASVKSTGSPIHTMNGVVIRGAAASGDLVRMKEIATKAEQYLGQTPEIQAALADLKTQIAKASS